MSLSLPNMALTVYTLPMDGAEAEARFLELLHAPGETWGAFYGTNMPALVAEIEQADAAGIPCHLIIDHIQASTPTDRLILAAMVPRLRHSDVTLSTAGPDSPSPSQIMHDKVLVTADPKGGEDWCWLGSVNFTRPGWLEANTATLFRSNAWSRGVFVPWFLRTRAWARAHVPQVAAAPSRMMVGTAPLDPRRCTVSLEDDDAPAPA